MSSYVTMKDRALTLAERATAQSEVTLRRSGFRDVYDLLMSDRDHPRQMRFLLMVAQTFSISERKALLNGLAAEYAGAAGWLSYIGHETRWDDRKLHSSLRP